MQKLWEIIVKHLHEQNGLHEIKTNYSSHYPPHSPVLGVHSHKRKRDEVGDSESADQETGSDENFGWGSEDDPLAAQNFVH